MRNIIIIALLALIVGCGSGNSPELDSNTVINPGGGLGASTVRLRTGCGAGLLVQP